MGERARGGPGGDRDDGSGADRRGRSGGGSADGSGADRRGGLGEARPPERIDHVGIAVESIDSARRFWESLGLEIEEIEEVPAEGVRVAMIRCGESRLELLEATTPDSPIAKFLETRGPGIHHLCLASTDVRADDARLQAAGYRVLRPEPTRGAGGCWVQFVHPKSAGGVLVELSEPGGESGERTDGPQPEPDREGATEGGGTGPTTRETRE